MNKLCNIVVSAALVGSVGAFTIAPAYSASPQTSHRQKTKNDWRNLSYLAGAAGIYGLLKGDKTLFFVGAAGALYSANRYEQDRKSQNKTNRARASMFSKTSFTRDGVRYVRHSKMKNGKKYYYFVKA